MYFIVIVYLTNCTYKHTAAKQSYSVYDFAVVIVIVCLFCIGKGYQLNKVLPSKRLFYMIISIRPIMVPKKMYTSKVYLTVTHSFKNQNHSTLAEYNEWHPVIL